MKLRDLSRRRVVRYWRESALSAGFIAGLISTLLVASPAVHADESSSTADTIQGLLAASSPPGPIQLLEFLAMHRRQLAFTGMAVYTTTKMLTPIKVIHDFDSGVERERITLMDGDMSEIVRTDDEILCLLPDDNILMLEAFLPGGGLPSLLASEALEEARNGDTGSQDGGLMQYTVEGAGRTRIADRDALRVLLKAVDGWRYSYEMLIDRKTSLLLQSSLLGDTGQVLEQFRFTDISLDGDIPDSAFETVDANGKRVRLLHGEPVVEPSDKAASRLKSKSDIVVSSPVVYALDWMPAGFLKIRTGAPLLLTVESPLMLSDGLAQITVFLDRYDPGSIASGASAMGSTNAYTLALPPVDEVVYAVTAIGEVPAKTVRNIVESTVRSVAGTDE